jgi:hypothetical protein
MSVVYFIRIGEAIKIGLKVASPGFEFSELSSLADGSPP